jgi:quaternary ammonium compound-resistance protein SugE
MHWWILLVAGLFEVGWMVGLKYSDGFRKPLLGAVAVLLNIVSVVLLAQAMKDNRMPAGTAYAVWTGIGAVGTATLGMLFWHEPRSALRLLCIGLIILGIIGLERLGEPR